MSLTSVGASVFVLCDSSSDVPLLQLSVPEEQDGTEATAAAAEEEEAAATAASDSHPVGAPPSSQTECAPHTPGDGAPSSHGNLEDGSRGRHGSSSGSSGRGVGAGGDEPAWLHVTCSPPTLRALARAMSAGQRASSGSSGRTQPAPSPFAARTEPFTVRVRLQGGAF